jgi:cell division septation protein DedD
MTASPVNLRNLEQIQEGSPVRAPRLSTLLLGATGIAAVVVSGVLLRERGSPPAERAKDPLAALVAAAQSESEGAGAVPQLEASELDFPSVLSDAGRPTTALVAVRDAEGRLVPAAPAEAPTVPDASGLVGTPRPAGDLLTASPGPRPEGDMLVRLATAAAEVPADAPLAEPGNDGGEDGFTIQVASFKQQDDADRFVTELQKRGHRAFRQAASVAGRGLWHRVRIGPFSTKYAATLYKEKLEAKERLTALVIDPAKVEQQERARAAKLAERIRQHGAP